MSTITSYDEAVAFLDRHIDLGWKPGLERMERIMEMMGSPQLQYPVIHVTGTNGKTTVTRAAASILTAMGLKVGTYTSPHLERIEERYEVGGEVASPEAFARAIADVEPFIDLLEAETDERATYFELTTAGAFAYFAETAVDVAVIEVGLGGRLDATNIVQSQVAVVTGISIEHTDYLGGTHESIGAEKLAILKPSGVLITGHLPEVVERMAEERAIEVGVTRHAADRDFSISDARMAVGGWSLDVQGLHGHYDDVLLPMHGRHQANNAAVAVAAVEALFDQELVVDVVREGLGALTSPGRIEVVANEPLVIIDGAHNPEAFEALSVTLSDEFPDVPWTLVIGAMGDKDLDAMLGSMEGIVSRVIATAAQHDRAFVPDAVAEAAERVLPGVAVEEIAGVAEAVAAAVDGVGQEGAVVVAGSLYVVGEARTAVLGHG